MSNVERNIWLVVIRWIAVLPVSIISYIIITFVVSFVTNLISGGLRTSFSDFIDSAILGVGGGFAFVASGGTVAPIERKSRIALVLFALITLFSLSAIFGIGVPPGKNISGFMEFVSLVSVIGGAGFAVYSVSNKYLGKTSDAS